jgi:pilus assembly protein Flp/PilA
MAVPSHRSSPKFHLHGPAKGTHLLKPATHLRHALLDFIRDESGQDLIEYALIAGLIGLAAVATMTGLSTKVKQAFNSVGNGLTNAT